MAIKIKFMFNEGREGSPLEKLSQISGEIEMFLRYLCKDIGISSDKGRWVATNFENGSGSVCFDTKYLGSVAEKDKHCFLDNLLYITDFKPEIYRNGASDVQLETISQFYKITKPIEFDERIKIGIYAKGDDTPAKWVTLTKDSADNVLHKIEPNIIYYGSVSGIIHELFKETKPPYFRLRGAIHANLVNCYFEERLYSDVISALNEKNTLIYVFGKIQANKINRKIEKVFADKIKLAPKLTDKEYDDFFGCMPEFTSKLRTSPYRRELSDNDQ